MIQVVLFLALLIGTVSVGDPKAFATTDTKGRLYIGAAKSPLSKNVLSFLEKHPDVKSRLTIIDVELDGAHWRDLESQLARCGISKTMSGIPALISEGPISDGSQRVECFVSDEPIIDKLRELNGCSMLRECVASKEIYVSGGWKTLWSKTVDVSNVCAGTPGSSVNLNLEDKFGMTLQTLGASAPAEVLLEIWSGKLSYIVASSATALPAESLSLTYRPPGDKGVLTIKCRQ